MGSSCYSFDESHGILLLVIHDAGSMALLLEMHLSGVTAPFLTLPYGEFAYGISRSATLLDVYLKTDA